MIDLTKQENIFIYHGGQQYGPMTYAQARQFMSKRPPTPSDLFWADGMKNWEPLPDSLLSQSALENIGGRGGLLLETIGAADIDQAPNSNQTRALTQPPLQTTAETRKPESQTDQPTRLLSQKKEEPSPIPMRTGLGGFFIPVVLVSLAFLGSSGLCVY